MVTITTPSSNPTPVYNRSGVTIDVMVPAASSAAPVPIVRTTGHTVVVVKAVDGNAGWVSLPSDAEIGDVVEVYPSGATATGTVVAVPSTSMLINNYTPSAGFGVYRLITSSNWGAVWSLPNYAVGGT